ncbi:glucose-1-phosphate cytidylyltransferase [Flavobacteriaceae bacterium]|nr:glucose-1-phosphate cytidylyltransferase [Flavobacteriaceae bacterium]
MKVVILAGGLGTRLSEETDIKPKPMVEIGGMPIIWHIMKIYSYYGYNDFVICLGYKGYVIKEFFANYFLHKTDVTIDLKKNKISEHDSEAEPWKITLVDTGNDSMTGGRIKRVQKHLENSPFMLTYGDGVCDVNINELVTQHKNTNSICTITAVQPQARFGALEIDSHNKINSFHEKPKGDGLWVNGGFMVCEPEVFDFIENDATVWEQHSMPKMAHEGKLSSYRHRGFWRPMDTLQDKYKLNDLWNSNNAKWKLWD